MDIVRVKMGIVGVKMGIVGGKMGIFRAHMGTVEVKSLRVKVGNRERVTKMGLI